ncbi:MAG: hypothetical protein KME59_13950 [Trichormus sp. ATA11-4-KO1]|jgi:tetratricopeptide (TPR) repeat protein|nr:hypothetical protein [Trichormus sp. ATA11-4-KO1]
MKVAVQQEDLQLLARTLQEQILAEIPSGEVFQIKCAVNKDELMILTQHPVNVTVDTQRIFAVLEEALQSLITNKEQWVQCFLRISGEKLPYAKCSLMMKQKECKEAGGVIPPTSSLTYVPSTSEMYEEELFDLVADTPDLLTTQPKRPVKLILLGIAFAGIGVLGSGVYLLTRPCVMSECQEMQTAQKLKTDSRQLMRRVRSENQLVALQQRLEAANADLTKIPRWSPYNQQAEELKITLSGQSEKINQVVKALQAASVAEQKTQTTANSLEELQARQHLWRQAIAPLEGLGPNSELYGLVQPKLIKYRVSLQTINQQLLAQEKWLKKLTDAKAVASVAIKREATAKSLNDWQKAHSTWRVVVNALNIIPQTSPAYQDAQNLLAEYKPQLARVRDRAIIEQLAAKSYQQAITTANQAKVYEQKNQWQIAVTYWDQALQNAKQISPDSFYYNQSQSLIAPYSQALQQAQDKLQVTVSWQQIRTDLDKTCSSEIQICTFMINDTGIVVSLTPEYEQVINSTLSDTTPENQSSLISAANHWQVLQEALAVIGDNANVPLFIYDTQGQGMYTHIPGVGSGE